MNLVFLQHPGVILLLLLSGGLTAFASHCPRAGLRALLFAGLSVIGLVLACLVCFVPYGEILTLLLILALISLWGKGEAI